MERSARRWGCEKVLRKARGEVEIFKVGQFGAQFVLFMRMSCALLKKQTQSQNQASGEE